MWLENASSNRNRHSRETRYPEGESYRIIQPLPAKQEASESEYEPSGGSPRPSDFLFLEAERSLKRYPAECRPDP